MTHNDFMKMPKLNNELQIQITRPMSYSLIDFSQQFEP